MFAKSSDNSLEMYEKSESRVRSDDIKAKSGGQWNKDGLLINSEKFH